MSIGFLSALRCFVEIVWSGYAAALKVVSRTRGRGWRDCLQLCVLTSLVSLHMSCLFFPVLLYIFYHIP